MLLTLLATATLFAPAPVEPAVEGPAALRQLVHPWGAWRVGAWSETETRSSGSDGAPLVERHALLRLRPAAYVLESTLRTRTGDLIDEIENSWALGGYAHVLPNGRVVATETLEVEGREYECAVWEGRWTRQGREVLERSWVAAGVALPLRHESRDAEGGGAAMRVTRLADVVLVGDRRVPCARYEGTARIRGEELESTRWVSLEVPGGVVRMETRVPGRTIERRVVRFGGRRRVR